MNLPGSGILLLMPPQVNRKRRELRTASWRPLFWLPWSGWNAIMEISGGIVILSRAGGAK